jgi:hypothetical protein
MRTTICKIFFLVLTLCIAAPKANLAQERATLTKSDRQFLLEFNIALDEADKALQDRPYHYPDLQLFLLLRSKAKESFDDSELGEQLNAKAMFYHAKKLQLLRNYPNAINYYSRAIDLGLKNTEIYLYRGKCFSELGEQSQTNPLAYDLAIADYTEAIKYNGECVDSYLARAVAKWRKADINPILRTRPYDSKELLTSSNLDFNHCLRLEPNSAETLYYRASLFKRLSRLDQDTSDRYITLEESDLSNLLDLKGEDCERYYFQAMHWFQKSWMHSRLEEDLKSKQCATTSLKLISKSIKRQRSFHMKSYLTRCHVYELLEDRGNQLKDINTIISNAPSLSIGYMQKGYFLENNNENEDAITAYKQASLKSEKVHSNFSLSLLYRKLGMSELADAAYQNSKQAKKNLEKYVNSFYSPTR